MKYVNFESINGTPMRLTREDDGEVLLQVFTNFSRNEEVSGVYIDVDEFAAVLNQMR